MSLGAVGQCPWQQGVNIGALSGRASRYYVPAVWTSRRAEGEAGDKERVSRHSQFPLLALHAFDPSGLLINNHRLHPYRRYHHRRHGCGHYRRRRQIHFSLMSGR